MNDYTRKHQPSIVTIVFIFALLCTGIFYEYSSCAFSIFLCIFLLCITKKEQKFVWRWNLTTVSVVLMMGFYLLSILWAVDRGMAFVGFLKFLPVLLFLMLLMQEKDVSESIFSCFPYWVAAIVVLFIVAMYIPRLESRVSVAGRLAGFFQYPNTFALLLLVAELLIIGRIRNKVIDYIVLTVLITGLLMTGSRTVFVLALVSNAVLILFHKNKAVRIIGVGALLLIFVGVVIYATFFDGAGVITRFVRFSLTESTFVGRFLYFIDAIPLILRYPFGLGYMGYYYMQQSIQTGLYSVMFIHNDWLQMMLDIGWIPCIFFIATIIKTVLNKKVSMSRKVILVTMFLHSCFDFNLQFIGMFLLLLLFLDYESGKVLVIKKHLITLKSIIMVVGCISIYCGVSLFLTYMGKHKASLELYPWNTQAQTAVLTEFEDMEEAGEIADCILDRNEYVTLAYTIKARQAYAKGDFRNVITYKNMLLEKAPFQYEECEEYAYMLINGISLYTKAGDRQSADVCRKELLALSDRLEQTKTRLSVLGKMIKDQPTTQFPQDIENYIKKMEMTK